MFWNLSLLTESYILFLIDSRKQYPKSKKATSQQRSISRCHQNRQNHQNHQLIAFLTYHVWKVKTFSKASNSRTIRIEEMSWSRECIGRVSEKPQCSQRSQRSRRCQHLKQPESWKWLLGSRWMNRDDFMVSAWRLTGEYSVIFVHGLTGNHVNTWTDRSTGVFWPEHLLKNDIPEARILSFGYDADIVHFWSEASQNCIGNHAQNLLNSLCQLRLRSDSVCLSLFLLFS